ncbi:hypothetical protein [Aquimarina sp. 2201CG5-10]|uniref:hypothetical protein n=1 Tax=Aquimarina callyspongiae TaxID=3098150 RepID=UPI002AB3ED0A|nr:hypothetical protein [Aquimarina sp. 2201CG5-10]MDY8137818.1 hypothetical protein [Aquimarina sp. 2201CG5-10]
MKNIFTVILCLVLFNIQAQEDNYINNQNRHEFRLDALEALAIPNIEVNYEYVISKYSGAGLAVSISLDNDFNEYQKYAIEPYYRQYFLNKKDFGARGLFVEGVLRFAGGEQDEFLPDLTTIQEENWFDMGIGLVVGQKWVSDNGFVFEISIGGGRYLLNNNNDEGFIRGGVLIGYRFF